MKTDKRSEKILLDSQGILGNQSLLLQERGYWGMLKRLKLCWMNIILIKMTNIIIAGTGSYLPKKCLSNNDLSSLIGNFDIERARASLSEHSKIEEIELEKPG